MADAGANAIVALDASGAGTVVAMFPVSMNEMPAFMLPSPAPGASPMAPPMVPTQAVPTSVKQGPDGNWYVSFLTGFPFPVGGAYVAEVTPDGTSEVCASGFTNAMDLAFSPDGSLYVLEIAHNGLLGAFGGGDASGGLWKVASCGATPEQIVVEGLTLPGGIAVDADGAIYVTNNSTTANGSSVLKIVP